MFDKLFKPMTLLLLGGASTAFTVAPVTLSLKDGPALLSLKPAFALAEKGRGGGDDDHDDDHDDDSGDDDDSHDDDDDDDDGDQSDSDHGSDDDDDEDDDSDDDSDDDDDDDSDDDDSADDDDDDNSGQGRGRGRGRGGNDTAGGGTGGGSGAPVRIVKFETGENSLEVTLSDGSKVEIENGRYEYKDPSGNTLVERRATQADVDKWMALR